MFKTKIKASKEITSNVMYSDYMWIKSIIQSCKTIQQIRTPITRLKRLFYTKHNNIEFERMLEEARYQQQQKISNSVCP